MWLPCAHSLCSSPPWQPFCLFHAQQCTRCINKSPTKASSQRVAKCSDAGLMGVFDSTSHGEARLGVSLPPALALADNQVVVTATSRFLHGMGSRWPPSKLGCWLVECLRQNVECSGGVETRGVQMNPSGPNGLTWQSAHSACAHRPPPARQPPGLWLVVLSCRTVDTSSSLILRPERNATLRVQPFHLCSSSSLEVLGRGLLGE